MSVKDYKNHIASTIETEPTEEPLTREEVKGFLRITSADENTLLGNLITTVRKQFETLTGRAVITQTWKAFYDGWPGQYFILPYPNLASVTHIKYTDSDADVTTWDADEYIVDIKKEPGRVQLGYGESFPSATLYPSNPIEIQFVCGYGLQASVPQDLKTMLLIGVERIYDRPHKDYDKLLKDIWDSFLINFRVRGV
jgi:uncharacterized phiE125 gp8 family phage protein